MINTDDTSVHAISCLNASGEYEHFQVPGEVFVYVRQLENFIRNPQSSKLKEVYGDRFK